MGIDAIVDSHQAIHVVFTTNLDRPAEQDAGQHWSAWYTRGEHMGRSWTAPLRLCLDPMQQPRIVQCGGEIHIVVGRWPHDFVSTDEGHTWQEKPQLLSKEMDIYCAKFDVAVVEPTIVVAFVSASHGSAMAGRRAFFDLWVMRRTGDITEAPKRVGTFPGGVQFQAYPKLALTDEGLVLACATNELREPQGIDSSVSSGNLGSSIGNVLLFRSGDRGQSWSAPQRLTPPSGADNWLSARQIEFGQMQSRPHLLLDSGGALHEISVVDSGRTTSHWLQQVGIEYLDSANPRGVAWDARNGAGMLAWIGPSPTTRNPLVELVSGNTWSDLFVAPFAMSGDTISLGDVRRITRPGNQVRKIALVPLPEGHLILWDETNLDLPLLGGRPRASNIYYAILGDRDRLN